MKKQLRWFICCGLLVFITSCQSDAKLYDLSGQLIPPEGEAEAELEAEEDASLVAEVAVEEQVSATMDTEPIDTENLPVYGPDYTPAGEQYVQSSSDAINDFIQQMSLQEKIGQLFMPTIRLNGEWITEYTPAYARELAAIQPGGLILYNQNIKSAEQLRQLIDDIQRDMPIPLIFSIDYEGGSVNRLRKIDDPLMQGHPSPYTLAQLRDLDFVAELARYTGKQLRSLGITMNLAPLADVLTNKKNTLIGDRAYGSIPHEVGMIVSAYIRGLQSSNVSAVVKHFPGQGSAEDDSHIMLTVSENTIDDLQDDLLPFIDGINAGVDAFMSSHVIFPRIYDDNLPASLSRFYIHDVLRNQLKYTGLIMTDSLSMRGVIDAVPDEDLLIYVLNAGNDFILKPQNVRESIFRVEEGLKNNRISEEQIDNSIRRILLTKIKRGLIKIDDEGFTSLYQTPRDEYIGSAESHRLYTELTARLR